MKDIMKKWWFWAIVIILLLITLFGNDSSRQSFQEEGQEGVQGEMNTQADNIVEDSTVNSQSTINLKFGELQSFTISPNSTKNCCIIKAKIEPSYNNKATINQNFFNVEDFIKNQNGNLYDEIQYWAVADMKSGEESKVISFTLSKDIIDDLYNNKIVANELKSYLNDFWVIESLK